MRQEKHKLTEECEQLNREVASLKKVKDKLFLEIQRIKMPPKKAVMTEKEIQTEREHGPEFTSKVAQLELQIEELQELNFEREQAISVRDDKI